MNNFVANLKLLLEEKDITQKELADSIKVTEVTISRYLNGSRLPRLDVITSIANYFNVSVDYLIGNSDIKNPYSENKVSNEKINTIAAHLDAEELSDDDLDDINKFIEFVKAKNKE